MTHLIVTPNGLVLPHMGKPARRGEPKANAAHLRKLGFPIAGEITAPGKIEGGDLVWLDNGTLLAGIGYRTNLEGARQLQAICGAAVEVQMFRHAALQGPLRRVPFDVGPEPARS